MAKLLQTVSIAAVTGLLAGAAFAADKSLTPEHKPAQLSPHAKPGAKAAEKALRSAVSPFEKEEDVFSGNETVSGETLIFPAESPSVKSTNVTLAAGEKSAWHKHGAALFIYILEGEVTVSYDGIGKKIYRAGDGFLEAQNVTHQWHNTGETPARALMVYMLGDGSKTTVLETPPGNDQELIQ